MVLIYGEGTFDNYRAALGAVGIETVVSMDTALARRCGGLLLPGQTAIFVGFGGGLTYGAILIQM